MTLLVRWTSWRVLETTDPVGPASLLYEMVSVLVRKQIT